MRISFHYPNVINWLPSRVGFERSDVCNLTLICLKIIHDTHKNHLKINRKKHTYEQHRY